MAGKRMKVSMDDASFAHGGLQQRTIDNWANYVSAPNLLGERIAHTLRNYLRDADAKLTPAFSIEAPSSKVVANLSESIEEIAPGERIMYRFQHDPAFRFNDSNVPDILKTTGNNLPNPTLIPLLLIGTYRAFIQRKQGPLFGLDWGITIAGCVTTCVGLGVAIHDN